MARTRSLIPWLLLAVVALIAYGSLYPFNFKSEVAAEGVWAALTKLSWARAGRSDHIANVLLYLPLGFCLFLWLDTRLHRLRSLAIATALGALLSLLIELAQVYISARVPSLKDLALNTLGSTLGAAGGLAWRGVAALMHLPSREEAPERDPGAVLVIATWILFRAAPFVPQFDLGKLKAALRPLFDPQWDATAVAIYLTCWLIVNQAAGSIVRRSRRLEALLLIIAAVLIGQLMLADQSFVPDELLALLLLLPMLVLMHRLHENVRRMLLLIATSFVLLIEGLAPFELTTTPSQFDLWPFRIWLEGDPGNAAASIHWGARLGRLFLYAALLWLLRDAGFRINVAIGLVSGAVLAIEVAQLWLVQQTGSITDPVLALLLGLLLRRFDHKRVRRSASAIGPLERSR